MENNEIPQPSKEGVVYGELAYWILAIGMAIAIVGMIIYMAMPGCVDKNSLLIHLWQGDEVNIIWEECAGVSVVPQGHWYLGALPQPDAISMLGIAVVCLAGVIGVWGAVFQLVRSRAKLYLIFALVVAAVLTLSALGIISLEH